MLIEITRRDGDAVKYIDEDRALREAVDALLFPCMPGEPYVTVGSRRDACGDSYFVVTVFYENDAQIEFQIVMKSWHEAISLGLMRATQASTNEE
mgnify:CR=1 FL=1